MNSPESWIQPASFPASAQSLAHSAWGVKWVNNTNIWAVCPRKTVVLELLLPVSPVLPLPGPCLHIPSYPSPQSYRLLQTLTIYSPNSLSCHTPCINSNWQRLGIWKAASQGINNCHGKFLWNDSMDVLSSQRQWNISRLLQQPDSRKGAGREREESLW